MVIGLAFRTLQWGSMYTFYNFNLFNKLLGQLNE